MTQDGEKTEKQLCPINRRKFCKTVQYAAIGALFSSALPGVSLGREEERPSMDGSFGKQEESVAKQITAVEAKVLSVKGICGMGHKPGDVTRFTQAGVEGKICIHALYSMLPAVFAMMFDAQFPWLEDPDTKTHACPDAANPVVFEITRIRE
jgi:uncharacterized repeat protein (TIGR04076 family)